MTAITPRYFRDFSPLTGENTSRGVPLTTVLEFIPAFLLPTSLPASDGIARASTARRERRTDRRRPTNSPDSSPRSRCGRYLNKAHVRERILVNDSAYASPAVSLSRCARVFPAASFPHAARRARRDLNRVLPPTRAHVGSHHRRTRHARFHS